MKKAAAKNANILSDAMLGVILENSPTASPKVLSASRRAAMKRSLLMRIAATDAGRDAAAYKLVRGTEGEWITFAPNVAMKVLRDDGATRSWLAKFGPGGCIPEHIQSGDEEAFILEGWCWLDDVRIECGDYHMIGKGQRHGNIHSPDGCLIFVRSHSENRHASQLAAVR
jgi:anti-sigma factor ChrR (cupin superfamily)